MNNRARKIREFLSIISLAGFMLSVSAKACVAATVSFYVYDNPGRSVTSLVDDSANVLNTYEYDSFGNVTSRREDASNNFKYAGEQFDEEIGFIFLRNRYYDPKIGRFISKDLFPGFVRNPQSKNPYVYASNNPVNSVDPLGLQSAIEYELAATLIAALVVLLGAEAVELLSKSYDGLSSIPGKIPELIIRWPDTLGNYNDNKPPPSIDPLTLLSIGVTAAVIADAFKWFADLFVTDDSSVEEVIDGPAISDDPMLIDTLDPFNRDPTYAYLGDFGLIDLGNNIYISSDFGGVSLSTTASLMLNIDDIAGATYDEATGQVIFFGKEDAVLPAMDLDDLAVAINSVYEKQEDPGVSIGTEASDVPGYMKVRYDGATAETEFGEAMFESDRQLKILSLGKDNETGQSVSSGVSGYKNMLDRYREDQYFPQGEFSDRMWFKPKEIVLSKSADDNDMVYDSVVMELLTESKFEGNVSDNPVAEAFADHFTAHYNEFAAERPILKELERLGKIVGVVKWIKDNEIPFDLSFVENYIPEYFNTDEYTPAITVETSWTEGDSIYTLDMTGGVAYTQPNEYLDDSQSGGAADATSQAAIDQRPSETDFSWNFNSSQSFTAVAQSLTRSRKDGNVRRREIDMNFPVEGDFPLALTRYYNSFADKASGFGLGWKATPYELRFPADKQTFTFGDQGLSVNVYSKIFLTDRAAGREDLYDLLGIDNSNVPIYARDGGADILTALSDGTFRLDKKDNSQTQFDSLGNLTRLTDKNGIFISYSYSNGILSSIAHQDGRTITLVPNGNTVTRAEGPGGRVISYTTNADGDLATVTNQEGQTTRYYYESDRRLKQIVDARGNVIYDASYDAYNRAVAQRIGTGAQYSSEFNLAESKSTAHGPNNTRLTKLFDEQYRVTESENTLASKVDITYAGDFGPETITDSQGNTTQYAYDSHGNLSYIRNAQGEESWFYFDNNDNLVAKRDSRGFDTVYGYDERNRLTTIYNRAVLNFDGEGNITGFSYDPENITTLEYDSINGNLLSMIDSEGKAQNFEYDQFGMPTGIARDSGYQTINTFDGLSRITAISNLAGESVGFGYNDADQITTMTTPAGQIEYTYDQNNNIDIVFDAKDNPTNYDYDANNNLNRVTDAGGGATTYAYDILNNLTQINLPNGSIKGQEFDELNRPIVERNVVVNPVPRIGVVTEEIDFGSTALGQSTNASFSIFNVGDKALNITNISSNNSNFSAGTTTGTINPGDALSVNVTFSANAQGQQTALLTIASDDPQESTLTIDLLGEVTLPSLNTRVISDLDGLRVSWDQYTGTGAFSYYAVYRETFAFTDVAALSPLTTISAVGTITYLDRNVDLDLSYYYAIVAFNSSGNALTEVDSFGPVSQRNLGKVGSVIEINSTATEQSPELAYNSSNNQYCLVYERSGDIYGQIISAEGSKIGGEFSIASTGSNELSPRVAYNSVNNEYLVVFEYDNGSYYLALGQRISSSGSKLGALIGLDIGKTERKPDVAYNSSNNQYLMTFEADGNGDSYTDIIRILMDNNGNLLSAYYLGAGSSRLANAVVAYNSVRNKYMIAFEFKYLSESNSYLACYNIDSNNSATTGITIYASKSFYPRSVYNPDRDRYALTWQNDSSTNNRIYIADIAGDVTSGSYGSFSITNHNMLKPNIAYAGGRNEYMFTFTDYYGGEYNVHAQRISSDTFDLLTAATISVATGASIVETDSTVVYDRNQLEYLVGYEYNNVDLRAQKIGEIVVDVHAAPTSLDFGGDLTSLNAQVSDTGGSTTMYLVNSSDQDWLSVTPGSVYVISQTPTATLRVEVDRSGLVQGNYSGNLTIDYQEGTINIPVTMSVANQGPVTPSSPTPANGSVNQSDIGSPLTVTMSWSASDPNGDALRYDVYFSDNQTSVESTSPSVQVAANQVSTAYKSNPLEYLKNYYWRVKAKDEQNAESLSEVWQFTTIAILAPTLNVYTPDPTQNKKPTLSWQSVSGASRYHLQIDNNADFSSPMVDDASLTSTAYTPATNLPEGRIYWRVSSIDSRGQQGSFSGSDDFLIDSTAPAAPTLNAYSPDPTSNRRPTLSWQTVTDAVNYHIQISRLNDFSTNIVDSHVSAASFTPTTDLPEGSIYWRVSSIDLVANESLFSSSDHFTINISAPSQVTGLEVTKNGNTVQLAWDNFVDTAGDFNHFNIYRENENISNVSGLVPLSAILDMATTSYLDTAAAHGETYFYAITAVDILGNENKSVFGAGPVLINTAPELDTIGDKTVGIDETLSFVISARDADPEDTLSYSAANLPSGASFNPNTQEFFWTPIEGQTGQYVGIHFEVSDGITTDFEEITISVGEGNHPPVLDSIGSKSVDENETLAFTVTASDSDGDLLSYAASNLPEGAVFDPLSQQFSWTPTYEQAGTYGGDAVDTDAWVHLEFKRSSGDFDILLDGIPQSLSKLDPNAQDMSALTDFEDLTNVLAVGSLVGGDTPAGTQFADGWIDEFSVNIPDSEPTNLEYKLLISADGTDGSTSFIDSIGNHPITAVGDAQIDTAQKVSGTGSVYFDGNGDYLSVPDSEDWNFGANDFTIDLQVKLASVNHRDAFVGQYDPGATEKLVDFEFQGDQPTRKLVFRSYNGTSYDLLISCPWTPLANTWYHIAVTRNGNNWYLFIDGTSQPVTLESGSYSATLSNVPSSRALLIGSVQDTYYLNGWIDELTIKKFIDPDLKLGIPADGTDGSQIFTDSTGQHPITAGGNAQIDTAQSQSGGASVLFDGSGDYLTIPDSEDWNFGSGDFTIDFWARFNSLSSNQTIIMQASPDLRLRWILTYYSSLPGYSQILQFRITDNDGNVLLEFLTENLSFVTNTWYHIELSRSGNNWYIFIDGQSKNLILSSGSYSTTMPDINNALRMGNTNYDGTYSFNGWIDELKISKPRPPVDPHTKIQILANGQDGSQVFTDETGNYPITAVGDAQIDTAQSQAGGSSALLDGSGDYLSVPDSEDWNFGTKDFGIDFWVRLKAKNKNQTFVSQKDSFNPGNLLQIGINDQNRLFFYFKSPSTYIHYGTSAPIHFEVSDGFKSDFENITITVNNANAPPVLEQIGPKSVDENQTLTFTVFASDPESDPLTYSASNLPEGATFDPLTQIFTWTPTYEQSGIYSDIHFEVSDGITSDSEDITITVNNVNRAPVLNAIGDKSIAENATLTFTVTGSDSDGDSLSYSASNLPEGATFDPLTQIFTWTPDYEQAGTYAQIHFEVSDGSVLDFEEITITVNNVNRAPALNAISDKSVAENSTLTFTVTASDSDGDSLTYSTSNLPEGATFDPLTQVFSWTPTYEQAGTYADVLFEVSDGQLIDSEGIVITVNDVDHEPPHTVDDYDGLWHNEEIPILLTATDDKSGVLNTYYKINDGQIYSVSINGQPVISAEGSGNTLEYWSVDNQGNEELPHNLLEVKLDQTSPTLTILSPENGDIFSEGPVTVSGMAEDGLSGIERVEIEVKGEIYSPVVESDGSFSMTGVEISGFTNTIKVTVWDAAGNSMKNKVFVYLGWKVYLDIDIPKFPHLINGVTGSQIILNYLGKDTAQKLTQNKHSLTLVHHSPVVLQSKTNTGVVSESQSQIPIQQKEIYEYGRYYNYPQNMTLKEFDPQAMDYVLGHFDPYDLVDTTEQGNPDTGYDFQIESFKERQFNQYLGDIVLGLASSGAVLSSQHVPVLVPAFGGYDHWLVLNGAAASENPSYKTDLTVFGFWFVDSAFKGIGSRVFVTPQAAKDTYFLPLGSSDIHKGQYAQVAASFDIQNKVKVQIEEPPINEENIRFIKSLQILDAKEALSIDWENLIHPALLTDKDFRKAFENSHARGPFKVRRIDQENSFYYLVFFDKHIKDQLVTSAAVILDAKDGSFREASWIEKSIEFVLINEEQVIERVVSENPHLLVEELSAELVWEPRGKTGSPYYPYWKVSSERETYFIMMIGEERWKN